VDFAPLGAPLDDARDSLAKSSINSRDSREATHAHRIDSSRWRCRASHTASICPIGRYGTTIARWKTRAEFPRHACTRMRARARCRCLSSRREIYAPRMCNSRVYGAPDTAAAATTGSLRIADNAA